MKRADDRDGGRRRGPVGAWRQRIGAPRRRSRAAAGPLGARHGKGDVPAALDKALGGGWQDQPPAEAAR